jgi:hypothetical protein
MTTLFFILELDENQFDGFAPIIFSCMTINWFPVDYWSSIWRYADTAPTSVAAGGWEGWL